MHAYGSRAMALGAAVVTAAVMTACGGGASTPGKARVAVATRDFNNPYWASLRDGADYQGKKMGLTVNVQAGSNETDAVGENAKISALASQNYSCYGAVPVNTTNVITPLVPVSRKNTPIINLDTQIDPAAAKSAGLKITSFIGSDNYNAGQIAGRAMLKDLGGTGQVIIIEGIPGEQNGINRETGFRATIKGKLQVVAAQTANYERGQGFTVTQTLLTAHPDINGIFSANDTMALGAAQAVADAGKTGKIKIISIDGIQEALQDVQSGKMTATITQYPYVEGIMVVEACQALAEGKSIPKRIVSPIRLIDKSDASKAISSFPRPFFPYVDPVRSLVGKG
jgi:ribose transport system substrate-binding protein